MKYMETKLKAENNYREFGKFGINMKLLYENVLLVKYKKSYAPIPSIKRQNVSNEFVDEILYILDAEQIDYEKLRELSHEENELFKKLMMKSGLFSVLKYNYDQSRESINDIIEQYEILKGEIEADNNNPELRTDVKVLLNKLKNSGKITQPEYDDIIRDL
jgi:hypothetical protein